ncbi:hypothetical protein MMC28_010053 [Mycoblastus sanguinarius]|nr:hypothetical protein [Mycoblastus sanguinarius]
MSPFEKLPREVRDNIYEFCLLYDGEIIPFPTEYDREELGFWQGGQESHKSVGKAFLGYSSAKESARSSVERPCFALLAVNSMIQAEAATILFGKNTWRLAYTPHDCVEVYSFWDRCTKYLRHLVIKFDFRDVGSKQLLEINQSCMRELPSSGHFEEIDRDTGDAIHNQRISCLITTFERKTGLLALTDLKSLSLDFQNLFCPSGCCRDNIISICFSFLTDRGPWNLDRPDFSTSLGSVPEFLTRRLTDVKISGLHGIKEKKHVKCIWGLDVD